MKKIKVNEIIIGNDQPFVFIAGLNVLEDEKTIEDVISKCISSTKKLGIPYEGETSESTLYSLVPQY